MDIDIKNLSKNEIDHLFKKIREVKVENKKKNNRKKVKDLMAQEQFVQRTKEWFAQRKNCITASDVGGVLEMSKYSNPEKVFRKKIEKEKSFKGNKFTEHGKCYEEIAVQAYEEKYKTKIHEFGLLIHPRMKFLGASPDGITEDGIMIEIKCPLSRKINGNIFSPKTLEYWVQMQMQLEVCNLDVCHFVECEISEYDSLEDFVADEDFIHKGVVGVVVDKSGENIYLYPPLSLSPFLKRKWIDKEIKKNYSNYKRGDDKLWKLNLFSKVEVKRDKKWFETIEPMLHNFWNKLLEYRENPESFEKDFNKNKNKSFTQYEDNNIFDECLF